MRVKKEIIIIIGLTIVLASCMLSFRIKPLGFSDFLKGIKADYSYVDTITIQGSSPNAVFFHVSLNEEKNFDETENLKLAIIDYIKGDDFISSLKNNKKLAYDAYGNFLISIMFEGKVNYGYSSTKDNDFTEWRLNEYKRR